MERINLSRCDRSVRQQNINQTFCISPSRYPCSENTEVIRVPMRTKRIIGNNSSRIHAAINHISISARFICNPPERRARHGRAFSLSARRHSRRPHSTPYLPSLYKSPPNFTFLRCFPEIHPLVPRKEGSAINIISHYIILISTAINVSVSARSSKLGGGGGGGGVTHTQVCYLYPRPTTSKLWPLNDVSHHVTLLHPYKCMKLRILIVKMLSMVYPKWRSE